ncbi:MAG: hypothetical protein KatS3mg115_1809 [Candidatus Poribacteria bacterium]|nr:MAG: hypothetical protein KatS3mg115_1809 [Candidatus Poribacteria bacterium]
MFGSRWPSVGAGVALLLTLGVLWLPAGCERSRAPEKVAVAFMETLLFAQDAQAAQRYADPALAGQVQQYLFGAQAAPYRDPIARELLRSEPLPSGWRFVYAVEYRPKGGAPHRRTFFVEVQQKGADWKVGAFGWEESPQD